MKKERSDQKPHRILNQTFARRAGKSLSALKKSLIDIELPKYLYSLESSRSSQYKKVFLEVGFGMGEHFVQQLQLKPDALHIGVEVYINGVANALKQIQNCNNFMLWPDDLDLMLDQMPPNSLDGIYVLFPDPWHKRRALKKRLFNQNRLNKFKSKLKNNGFIAFASDIDDYFEAAHKLLELDQDLIIKSDNFTVPHLGYVQTKYHSKAIKESRIAQFIQAYLQTEK